MRSEDKLVDLDLDITRRTEKAVAVVNLKEQTVWLPKSLIEIDREGSQTIITMPQWLAEDRELV